MCQKNLSVLRIPRRRATSGTPLSLHLVKPASVFPALVASAFFDFSGMQLSKMQLQRTGVGLRANRSCCSGIVFLYGATEITQLQHQFLSFDDEKQILRLHVAMQDAPLVAEGQSCDELFVQTPCSCLTEETPTPACIVSVPRQDSPPCGFHITV